MALARTITPSPDATNVQSFVAFVEGKRLAFRAVIGKHIFAEMKQRKLVQWALAYVAAAFALLQGIDIVAARFGWPEQTMRFVIIALSVGLFVTMVLAWYHGERGAQRISGTELMILALLLAIGGGFLWRFAGAARGPTVTPVAAPAGMPAASASEKSIAVLPFENLSHDPENAYFAEGVQDEILTRLAKIADLKVISRTSTQRFKSVPGDLRQIAQQLGVTNILEGSVQKTSDQVRVNVQLINATTDAHLWADTYDRKLTDIFAVESEIAKSVAETLQAKLTGSAEHVLASRPTENPEAHQLYLKGRYFWNRRTSANLKKAIEYFQQAIDKDPGYALAYAGLADAYVLLPAYAATPPRDDVPKAMAAAKKALQLDDTLAEAHVSLAQALCEDMQLDQSIKEFQRAIALNPNYATAHHWHAVGPLTFLGRFDEALAEARRAQELDPLSVIINADIGDVLLSARRYDEAIAQFRKAMEMEPGFYYVHWGLGRALEGKGALPEAIAEYKKATELDPDPVVLSSLGHAYAVSGRKDEARKVLDKLTAISKQRYVPAIAFTLVYAGLGDKEQALRFLEKSYNDRAGFDLSGIRSDRALDPLRGDPRFKNLVERILSGKPE